MASFNKVYLMGNLTRDPDVRTTPTGLKIAKLSLAVNRRFRTQDNQQRDETTYVDIDAFDQKAEVLERYCKKGSPLFVEGRLRLDKWQTSNGENRSKLTVVLQNFEFIGGRESDLEEGDSASSAGTTNAPNQASAGTASHDDYMEDDDNIPF